MGGPRIAAFSGLAPKSDHTPEDWIGSDNTTFAAQRPRASHVADGTLVRDAIQADPEGCSAPSTWPASAPTPPC